MWPGVCFVHQHRHDCPLFFLPSYLAISRHSPASVAISRIEKAWLREASSEDENSRCSRSATRELGCANIKPEQLDVVEAFVKGRDVFAVLPNGYGKSLCGKSLCLGCLPLVFDKQLGKEGGNKSRRTEMPRPSVHA